MVVLGSGLIGLMHCEFGYVSFGVAWYRLVWCLGVVFG